MGVFCTLVSQFVHVSVFPLTVLLLVLTTATDTEQNSSGIKAQHEEAEQSHGTERFKSCFACDSFWTSLFLCGVPMVQAPSKVTDRPPY